jgi:hypothetical protein
MALQFFSFFRVSKLYADSKFVDMGSKNVQKQSYRQTSQRILSVLDFGLFTMFLAYTFFQSIILSPFRKKFRISTKFCVYDKLKSAGNFFSRSY